MGGVIRGAVLGCVTLLVIPHGRVEALLAADQPTPGQTIPTFGALDTDGNPVEVSFPDGSTTVLLFFASGCSTCHDTIPEWNHAYDRKPARTRVLGIILDQEPPGFWQVMKVRFPVVRAPDSIRKLHLGQVPATLRVGAGGRIHDAVSGIVGRARLAELFMPIG
jgi:hypothetical protein